MNTSSPLFTLTMSALAGIAARPPAGHNVRVPSADELGREALALAKGPLKALESEPTPEPEPELAPATRPGHDNPRATSQRR